MSKPYRIDKILSQNLAIKSEDNEDTIAREQLWMVIHAFEKKLEKYDLDELVLLKIYLLTVSQYDSQQNKEVNAVFIRLIDKQINKLS